MDSTTPWGKYFLRAIGLAGFAFPPLRIASFTIGILGKLFFGSKAKQICENKCKLSNAIAQPSRDALAQIHSQAIDFFDNEILEKHAY